MPENSPSSFRASLRLAVALGLIVALVLAACGSGASPTGGSGTSSSGPPGASGPPGWPVPGQVTTTGLIPLLASAQLAVGPNRFLFTMIDQANMPAASPDLAVSAAFYDLERDPGTPTSSGPGSFVWAIEGARGFYTVPVSFDHAGEWGVEFTTSSADGSTGTIRVRFTVRASGTTPAIGTRAPASRTPTLADFGGDPSRISSDPHPVAAFYAVSVDQALAAGTPFVLVFATPAFCTSAVCGPTLERVKQVAAAEPGFTVINVEPYELELTGGKLQPTRDSSGNLRVVQAALDYGLPTEPWIFVVDRGGIVRASFEAVVSVEELSSAIRAVR